MHEDEEAHEAMKTWQYSGAVHTHAVTIIIFGIDCLKMVSD